MNYGQLKANVLALIGRAPADVCYQLTTADINSFLRLSIMESTATIAATEFVTLPADFRSMCSAYIDTNPRSALTPTSEFTQNTWRVLAGTPTQYAIVNGQMRLNPVPDGTYNVVLRYIANLPDFVVDTDTNVVLDRYPGVYVYGALTHHATLMRDVEAAAVYKAGFNEQIRLARADDVNSRYSGTSPRVASGFLT